MDETTKSGLHEALLAQTAWMRRLAASLVRDPESADDLVQDTWVAALRSPPRDERNLRPFLARVLQRLAARRWTLRDREPARRDVDELAGGPLGASGDELAERLDAQRALLEELRALAEPYRETLILHYHSGLPLVEIARRLGVPAGTVRWRLHEGLAALRARLDRRSGSRANWCLAFAALHGWPEHALTALKTTAAAGTGAALTTGVLVVNTATKLALALFAVAAVALGLYFGTRDEVAGARAPLAPAESLATPATPSAPAAEPERIAAPEEARRESSAPRPQLATEHADAPNAIVEDTRVVARVLDELLRPVSTAQLVDTKRALVPEARARARASGDVELVLPPDEAGGERVFEVRADGFATVYTKLVVRSEQTNYLGDVVLKPGGIVTGRVRDAQGRPLEGVELHAVLADSEVFEAKTLARMRLEGPRGDELHPRTRSGADGTYRFDAVPCTVLRVWAKAPELRWSFSAPFEPVPRAETARVDLVLEPYEPDGAGAPIEGVVVGPDAAPLPGIRIQIVESQASTGNRYTRSQATEDGGRFRIVPKSADASIRLTFADPKGRFADAQLEDVRTGTRDLVVELQVPLAFELDVRDDRGPVEAFRARWKDASGHDRGRLDGDEPHPGGVATLRAPRESFTLVVDSEEHRETEVGPLEGRKTLAPVQVELRRLAGVRGRVVADGKPVAGVELSLLPAPTNVEISVNGFDSLFDPTSDTKSVTDAEGRFVLGLVTSGRYVILADARGYARAQHGPLELDAGRGLADLEIALDRGGVLEGRVITAKGRSPAGTIVAVNRGDCAPRTQVVGPDGAYRFEHLTPGPYELKKARAEFTTANAIGMNNGPGAKPKTPKESFVIQSGVTTRRDLDLSADEPAVLDVALTLNGKPASAWSLTLWPADTNVVTEELPSGTTDAAGRARIESDRKGDVVVWIKPPPELSSALRLGERITLRAGVNDWTHDMRLGSVEGMIPAAAGSSTAFRVRRANVIGEEDLGTVFRVDADGRFSLGLAPAGELVLERLDPDARGGVDWRELRTFVVPVGELARVEVR